MIKKYSCLYYKYWVSDENQFENCSQFIQPSRNCTWLCEVCLQKASTHTLPLIFLNEKFSLKQSWELLFIYGSQCILPLNI